MNCHGCKWLDEIKKGPMGAGYCAYVVRADSYIPSRVENGKLLPSSCVRKSDMERCELYAVGNYATRFQEEV